MVALATSEFKIEKKNIYIFFTRVQPSLLEQKQHELEFKSCCLKKIVAQ